jgi:hypothetical protein
VLVIIFNGMEGGMRCWVRSGSIGRGDRVAGHRAEFVDELTWVRVAPVPGALIDVRRQSKFDLTVRTH